jgi:ribosomal protein S18 acetylase RimI-like enzyme
MNIVIAPIAESHASGFRACLDIVAREKRYLAQIEAPPLERVEAFVRDSVANDYVQFTALDVERGDFVVGWADIFVAWPHAMSHRGTLGMGILPEYRGRGVGRRLLETCISKAWSKGITRIELEVRADNTRAIKLYEKFGFIQEALKSRAMRFDGVYYDAIQMSLLKQ